MYTWNTSREVKITSRLEMVCKVLWGYGEREIDGRMISFRLLWAIFLIWNSLRRTLQCNFTNVVNMIELQLGPVVSSILYQLSQRVLVKVSPIQTEFLKVRKSLQSSYLTEDLWVVEESHLHWSVTLNINNTDVFLWPFLYQDTSQTQAPSVSWNGNDSPQKQ